MQNPHLEKPEMEEFFKDLPANLIMSNGNEIWTRHNQRPGRKIATIQRTGDGARLEARFEDNASQSERELVLSTILEK